MTGEWRLNPQPCRCKQNTMTPEPSYPRIHKVTGLPLPFGFLVDPYVTTFYFPGKLKVARFCLTATLVLTLVSYLMATVSFCGCKKQMEIILNYKTNTAGLAGQYMLKYSELSLLLQNSTRSSPTPIPLPTQGSSANEISLGLRFNPHCRPGYT